MRKRLTSVLLCFLLCAAFLPVSAQTAETAANAPEIPTEGDVWDGSITQPTKMVQKDGVYYYEITKCSELAYVAQTGGDWLEYNYILGNNLILNDVELTWDKDGNLTTAENLLEWTPLSPFSGQLIGNGYVISGLFCADGDYRGLIGEYTGSLLDGLTVVNTYISGGEYLGGIVSWMYNVGGTVQNCIFEGCINGSKSDSDDIGGICGYIHCGYVVNCVSNGLIIGKDGVGGIVGYQDAYEVRNCINNAAVVGQNNVGGICGFLYYPIRNAQNNGSILGESNVGGIVGKMGRQSDVYTSCNTGVVSGREYVGGIAGFVSTDIEWVRGEITNSYNTASVSGKNYVGGIAGTLTTYDMQNCYSIGAVSGTAYVGGIVGDTKAIWGNGVVSSCYFLDQNTENSNLFGLGCVSDEYTEAKACTASELKEQKNYASWTFSTSFWGIDASLNDGYPYLYWQEGLLSSIPVSGISLSDTALELSAGDCAYLTATVSPTNASSKAVTWKSSAPDVAAVSAAGKVTAVSAGTSVITVTTADGGHTATCTVTVTARLAEEYRINSITVRSSDGTALSAIPKGTCLATVSVTNLASQGNTLVFLAAYSPTGQYQGMMWVSVEDLPVGATIRLTLPVDNSGGTIENLKAFTVASFSDLTPLGNAISFLP